MKTVEIETIDIQKSHEWFPDPVACIWTQLDRIKLSNEVPIVLKTTVETPVVRSKSFANCFVWRESIWEEIWRIDADQMQTVAAFVSCALDAYKGIDVYDRVEIREGVMQDVARLRMIALTILAPGVELVHQTKEG